MKPAKCPNCGAKLMVDETKDAGICEYCDSPFITEKAINQVSNTTNNAQIINNYYGAQSVVKVPKTKRPKLNLTLAIFLCIFYLIPGIIYILCVKSAQKEWDDKYTY